MRSVPHGSQYFAMHLGTSKVERGVRVSRPKMEGKCNPSASLLIQPDLMGKGSAAAYRPHIPTHTFPMTTCQRGSRHGVCCKRGFGEGHGRGGVRDGLDGRGSAHARTRSGHEVTRSHEAEKACQTITKVETII